MEIHGYKGFYSGLMNRYGHSFDLNRIYTADGPLAWGKSGFHFCENLEDVLRYYNGKEEDIIIARVVGLGDVIKRYDSYNDYEIVISSKMMVTSIMSRDDILAYANRLNGYRLKRFIDGFDLTENEINMLYESESKRFGCR